MSRQTIIILISSILAVAVVVIVVELLVIRYNASPVPIPKIPRGEITRGNGNTLRYLVMGDSTSISQGSDYSDGYAIASLDHLAESYEVTMLNSGISGATVQSVVEEQLEKAVAFKPDLVLLAVGANDTTHFTSSQTIQDSAQKIVDGLRAANQDVTIVVTRSPAMDSVTRFPFISKWVMAIRTKQVNDAFAKIIEKNSLTLAPIAEKTRQAFLDDPTLTAQDHFHPNARGYALWKPVINSAIDQSLE